MHKHNIKAVIFDLGNVLVDFDHRIAAKKIMFFTGMTAQEIFNLFFDSDLTGLFEEGKISAQDFFSRVKAMLNLKLGYEEFLPIWNEIFFLSEKNNQVHNLARMLKKKYKIAVLSNINILHYEYLKKNFSIFSEFHNIFTSFELKLRKPHPLIYQKVLENLKLLPEEIFYTDDRPELIQSAKSLGIRSFVFTDIKTLQKDLTSCAINIS